MHAGRFFCFLSIILFFLFGRGGGISYGEDTPRDIASLVEKYHSLERELENSSGPIPFHLESAVSNHASRADIYGVMKRPFAIVENVLLSPDNWCHILLLHDNVRACTYAKAEDAWKVTVYQVNRPDEPLERAYQMNFTYRLLEQKPAFLEISLASAKGPFGTTDHQFQLEAIPLGDGSSFIHLGYSFRYSPLAYLGINEYLAIFGHGKVGFTVRSIDRNGKPVYVDGLRGVIERNTVRYYLALLAYLDTLEVPQERRFEERVSRWYDLTSLYRRQLFDMDKEEYLADKRKDRENQRVLQASLADKNNSPGEPSIFRRTHAADFLSRLLWP